MALLVALASGCASDETSAGGESETETGQDGPTCGFTLTASPPELSEDPEGCYARTTYADCDASDLCRPVELARVRCTDGMACAEPEPELVLCVPFEVVCLPNNGTLLCEVEPDGTPGAAWVAYDACDVPGFARCESSAEGLSTPTSEDHARCDG